MADYVSDLARSAAADGVTIDAIRLHSGDPGTAGTANALGAGISAATWGAAAAGVRSLSTDVTVTGLAASQSVTHFSVWETAGAVFKGWGTIDTGDVAANASGEYILSAGSTFAINNTP